MNALEIFVVCTGVCVLLQLFFPSTSGVDELSD
jgi:hypothetical protein